MELQYLKNIRTAFNPAHIQIALDGTFLALPLTRTTAGVWSLQDLSFKPLELEGHRKTLRCMCFGHGSQPKYICTAADDYVIVWNIHLARQAVSKGNQVKGKVIGTTLGCIQYCSFSPDDKLVAACCENDVIILEIKNEKVLATVEGHTARLTGAEFCPHYTSTLVTISEDRTFKVWDISDFSLVYQSQIITASPFISMSMNIEKPQVAIGTADGQVRVYDLTDGNGFRCLHQLDVEKIVRKQKEKKFIEPQPSQGPVKISSRPSWKRPDQSEEVEIVSAEDEIETGSAILGLHFTYGSQNKSSNSSSSTPSFLRHENTLLNDLLDAAPMLCIGTTGSLLQINAKTLDVYKYFDLQDDILTDILDMETVVLNAAGSVYFSQGSSPDQIWCIVGSHFQNTVNVLQWKHAAIHKDEPDLASAMSAVSVTPQSSTEGGKGDSLQEGNSFEGITVLSNTPLLPNSALRSEMVKKVKEDPKAKKTKGATPKNKPGQMMKDQPITFHHKVKSSGYTETPRQTPMFKPQTNFSKSASSSSLMSHSSSSSSLGKSMDKTYPMKCDPPTECHCKIDVAERPTPINRIQFSDDGQYLATALSNKSGHVFKLPLGNKGFSCTGHNNNVNGITWSHDGNWLLTSSDDKSAFLWSKGQSDPNMCIKTVLHNMSTDKDTQKKDKDNVAFPKEVNFAQFYYMDKFILLTSGNTLYMYKYHLEQTKDDIKRYLSTSKYKQVTSLAIESQQITAASAVNDFYSYIVMCAGTNKSVTVFDMNVGRNVRIMADVHTRPAHVICQNKGSTFVSHPSSAYDLFVTAAAGDCIKLWDLRADRCVRRYEGHQNRAYTCGLDLSPCGRYLATGSEDKTAYIFDLRAGTYCSKLGGHNDTVSDVAFHPLYPQLVTATLDGKLRLYKDK
ncbi:WD repeat-containing protein 27-like isoform X1 [Mytilus galloprovincialis]|uniref:WD repeat-containing protein 27-like isoform X1 n=1 Tax=Mytilus galloprovincialis TaxID=29158 RepID=UPI003F7C5330